jgi:NADPH-dependent 2,4-dienoyl-CoA reductase/sulfur reductase-like enzyme
METDIAGVHAAGDCVETWHRLLGAYTYLPLGTTSHKQGRVAGENAVGGSREYQGSLGTQVVKVFELPVERTGPRDEEARKAGFQPSTVESRHFDHKAYRPGAHELCISVTSDRSTGRAARGADARVAQAEVAKRIDVRHGALSGHESGRNQRSRPALHAAARESLGCGTDGGAGLEPRGGIGQRRTKVWTRNEY